MATTRKQSAGHKPPRRRQLTDDERGARRQEKLEQLRRASAALLTSEGWQRWLRTRARFHRYSLNNTLLIATQCHEASYVAGFQRWLERWTPVLIPAVLGAIALVLLAIGAVGLARD